MAVVVGCGGSGTDSRGTTTGVAGTDASAPTTVNLLAKPGQIELVYLTGQGRVGSRADGDVIATVGVPQFRDNTGTPTDLVTDSPPLVQLNSYQNQIYRINVPIVTIQDPLTNRPVNSREFDTYPLTVNKLRYTLDGSTSTLTSVVGLPITLPTKIRVFPGRYTSVPVYLNDAQFPITSDDTGTFATFNRTQFDTDNSLDTFPSVPAFLSDYLAFDISGLTDAKPVLNGKSGVSAGRFFMSGDGFALSEGGTNGYYEALTRTPGQYVTGRFAPPGQLGVGLPPGVTSATTPGTYSLFQPDPSNPDPSINVRITSMQGIWRDYTKMILNMGTDLGISFPGSDDGDTQDIILFNQAFASGVPKIKRAYFGVIDLGALTVRVYPLKNVSSATTTDGFTGTVTSLLDKNGAVTNSPQLARQGSIQFTTAPTGLPKTVNFYVYRY
jgi:hypothetical protein